MQKSLFKGNRKGMGALANLALGVGVAIFVVTVIAVLVTNLRDTQTAGSAAYNIADDGLTGITTFGDWWQILVIAGIVGVVLSLIYALGGMGGKR